MTIKPVNRQYRQKILLLLLLAAAAFSAAYADAEVSLSSTRADSPGFFGRFWRFFLPHRETRTIIHRQESRYFDISVEEDERGFRHLVFNPRRGSQTIIDPSRPLRPVSSYIKYTFLSLAMRQQAPERVLFIGLGGGIMPMMLRQYCPGTEMDLVELDPAVPEIARDYFFFRQDEKMKIHIGDGRRFLNHSKEKYDLIFLDAYNAESIPFHLTTREFHQLVQTRLSPDGLLVVNSAELADRQFNANEIKTMQSVYQELLVYLCEKKTNYVFIAGAEMTGNAATWQQQARILDEKNDFGFRLQNLFGQELSRSKLTEKLANAVLLTDDYAPVNLMK